MHFETKDLYMIFQYRIKLWMLITHTQKKADWQRGNKNFRIM